MTFIAGIDEAGRGPVIGPLVIAGVKIKEQNEKKILALGVKDSKLLSPKQREKLYYDIIKLVEKYKIYIIQPEEIDKTLESSSSNLNWLEGDYSAKIINELKPDKAILDCPSNNPKAYTDYIKKKLKVKTEIKAEHKADLNYPIVAAASILAKVTRDKEIVKIIDKIGKPTGSGYPSDPATKKFIKENYKSHPEIFRKTWQTYKDLIKEKQQSKLGEF
jgi:ribonuclease HII